MICKGCGAWPKGNCVCGLGDDIKLAAAVSLGIPAAEIVNSEYPTLKVLFSDDGRAWMPSRWYQLDAVGKLRKSSDQSLDYNNLGYKFRLEKTDETGTYKMTRENGSQAYLKEE